MERKKIAVIGVGGRTGTMFATELSRVADILGVGKDIKEIREKKLLVHRGQKELEVFSEKVISPESWPPKDFLPKIIFLATKNPIRKIVKFYYQKLKEKSIPLPDLVLSQNGIDCLKEAEGVLKEILGPDFDKIRIIRISLFNPIDRKKENDKTFITYKLPIRLAFGKFSGKGTLRDISALFKEANIEAFEVFPKKLKEMELSKLFLNLIGMVSATKGLLIKEGFKNKEIFKEEILVLKEYIKVVRKGGYNFLNFPHYPIKTFTFLIELLPLPLLLPFRNYFAKIITRSRKGKRKDLSEIHYYNGAVVRLGAEIGIPCPLNQKVIERVLK